MDGRMSEPTPPHREDVTVTMPRDMWEAVISAMLNGIANDGQGPNLYTEEDMRIDPPEELEIEALKVVKAVVRGVSFREL